MPASFVIYADMDTFCERMDVEEPDNNRTGTVKLTNRVDMVTKLFPPKIYRTENVSEHFLRSLLDENKRIKAILNDPEPLSMSAEDV